MPPLTQAQDGDNLLEDGSFEGAYLGRAGRGDLNIPEGWNVWYTESPRNEYWQNLPPVGYPHRGPDPDPRSGSLAINLVKDYATFTAAVYQQAGVGEGANLRARAYAWLRNCKLPEGSGKCSSSSDGGAFVRIGIDPNGGTDPNDGDIVWSGNSSPHDNWGEISVDATATAGTVTVFLYISQNTALDLNRVYFDDASLRAEGGGGAASSDGDNDDDGDDGGGESSSSNSAPGFVGFVSRQGERDDGSIVHVVQSGDTVDSIAVAYGLTRQDILDLNNISDPRIIFVGQELIVQASNEDSDNDNGGAEADSESEGDESADDDSGDEDSGDENDESSEDESGDSGDEDNSEDTENADEDDNDDGEAGVDMLNAPPAPVISVASGEVLPPINPESASATLCVVMFEDANQNRIQEDGEALVPGGAINLNANGSAVSDYETDGASEPHCFSDLAAGEYIAAASAPSGYGLTTPNQLRVSAGSGARVNIAFGVAEGVAPPIPPPADSGAIANEAVAEPEELSGNVLSDNLGLIVFGLAAVVLVAGISVSLLMRR
jgi:murein DD-endopeptidase MepM/ murein hydrolase activator NlpD